MNKHVYVHYRVVQTELIGLGFSKDCSSFSAVIDAILGLTQPITVNSDKYYMVEMRISQ